jgi:hypothetical protein
MAELRLEVVEYTRPTRWGLGKVWLYRNDRQIKAISYRETEADDVSYTVTIRELARYLPMA